MRGWGGGVPPLHLVRSRGVQLSKRPHDGPDVRPPTSSPSLLSQAVAREPISVNSSSTPSVRAVGDDGTASFAGLVRNA